MSTAYSPDTEKEQALLNQLFDQVPIDVKDDDALPPIPGEEGDWEDDDLDFDPLVKALFDRIFAALPEGEFKVADMSRHPGATRLRTYWTRGKGALKIRWGVAGDYKRCVRQVRKYVGPRAEGMCNHYHQVATGHPPGKGPHVGGKEFDFSQFENVTQIVEQIIEEKAKARIVRTREGSARYGVAIGTRLGFGAEPKPQNRTTRKPQLRSGPNMRRRDDELQKPPVQGSTNLPPGARHTTNDPRKGVRRTQDTAVAVRKVGTASTSPITPKQAIAKGLKQVAEIDGRTAEIYAQIEKLKEALAELRKNKPKKNTQKEKNSSRSSSPGKEKAKTGSSKSPAEENRENNWEKWNSEQRKKRQQSGNASLKDVNMDLNFALQDHADAIAELEGLIAELKKSTQGRTLVDAIMGGGEKKSDGFDIETKVRRVRTPAGVAWFDQPLGSIIVRDSLLKNLKTVKSDYDGWEKYKGADGKDYYSAKDEEGYFATDADGNTLAEGDTEDEVLKKLDAYVDKQPKVRKMTAKEKREYAERRKAKGTRKTPVTSGPSTTGIRKVRSDYEDYDKYSTPAGNDYYTYKDDHGTISVWDGDDWVADTNSVAEAKEAMAKADDRKKTKAEIDKRRAEKGKEGTNSVPDGEVVNDPSTGNPRYIKQKDGHRETRLYPDGSMTVIDTRKKSGTNRTIAHTGPNPERAFMFDTNKPEPKKPEGTPGERRVGSWSQKGPSSGKPGSTVREMRSLKPGEEVVITGAYDSSKDGPARYVKPSRSFGRHIFESMDGTRKFDLAETDLKLGSMTMQRGMNDYVRDQLEGSKVTPDRIKGQLDKDFAKVNQGEYPMFEEHQMYRDIEKNISNFTSEDLQEILDKVSQAYLAHLQWLASKGIDTDTTTLRNMNGSLRDIAKRLGRAGEKAGLKEPTPKVIKRGRR